MTIQVFFTDRHGGVSAAPYDSLNLGDHVGDRPAAVDENRRRLARRIGNRPIVWMKQVHGDNIRTIDDIPTEPPVCDALVTDRDDIALAVMTADCIPILMADRKRGVVAAVHAGRNGTLLGIGVKTLETMTETFRCRPKDIDVMMGPAIGPCCYEVSEEVAKIVRKSAGEKYVNGRYLDLKSLNRDAFLKAGIEPGRLQISDICTCCDRDHFSYRRDGVTGRFAGVIYLISGV